ncbi:MAG: penicillin-binding protein 2 [Limisphaerales bacterium]|jgi:penicillin-binding protein 2
MLIFDQLKKSEPQVRVLSLLILLGMSILLVGLWHVQVISAKRYQANLENQSRQKIRIPALRGGIYDRNGQPLAVNQASFSINLYLEDLRPAFNPEYKRLKAVKVEESGKLTGSQMNALERLARFNVINGAAQKVSSIIQRLITLDPGKVHRHWETRRILPMPVAEKLSPIEVARFAETPFDRTGTNLDLQPRRHYPHNETAAHILGYLTVDDGSDGAMDSIFDYRMPGIKGVGQGVESYFNSRLAGEPGGKSVLINHVGYRQSEDLLQPSRPGDDVHLTIDLDVQKIAERALAKVSQHVRGAVVVMNPRNGDILALVSAPAFDPNRFPGVSHEYYNYLMQDDRQATRCRATQENFSPGSIFKIVVALACLEKGTMNPHERYKNEGYIMMGRRFADEARPGMYDFRRAFIKSSNSYFIHHGDKVGPRLVIEMGNRFFLGQHTKVPTWQDNSGQFHKVDAVAPGKWYKGDTANLCMGQGRIDMTPLQAAVMTSAVVNGGVVYWPRLHERVSPHESRQGRKGRFNPPGKIRGNLGVRTENLRIVVDAMLADVDGANGESGTGKHAAVPGVRIGGKTGTAEIKRRGVVVDKTTWFTSFAAYPGEAQPRYVVVVLVESGGSGGKTAAPVAGRIYRELLARDKPTLRVADTATSNF